MRHPTRRGQPVVTSLRHPQDEGEDLPLLLLAMARLWLAGTKLDASVFYRDERRRRVALPTYAFDRRRYWIEPGVRLQAAEAAIAEPALGKRPELADWFYLPSWKCSLPPAPASLPSPWLVFVDRSGLGVALVARLAAAGREVIAIEAGERFQPLRDGVYAVDPRRRGFDEIGIDDNFFDLGGDSFVAVQVVSRLKEALQVDLPMAQLFQRLTIRSLAELLAMEESEAIERRAEQLAERRESMSRRRAFQQRRRSQKKSKPPQG